MANSGDGFAVLTIHRDGGERKKVIEDPIYRKANTDFSHAAKLVFLIESVRDPPGRPGCETARLRASLKKSRGRKPAKEPILED